MPKTNKISPKWVRAIPINMRNVLQNYSMDCYFRQYWRDERLSFTGLRKNNAHQLQTDQLSLNVKMLEKMQPISSIAEERSEPIRFPQPERLLSSPIIRLEHVQAGYQNGKPILRNIDLRIDLCSSQLGPCNAQVGMLC